MKLAWATDIHLNFLKDTARQIFYGQINDTQCDAVLISGDIAEATSVKELLIEMVAAIKKPIYFVLGNHDYYKSDLDTVKSEMAELTKAEKKLFWLPAAGIQILEHDTILLGQDGWADGRLGDYANSNISLNDSRMITDLFQAKIIGKFQLLEKMQQLADADAIRLQTEISQAISQNPKKILVLTHVPPFKEVCMHKGEISDENWLPYFSSKVMGDVFINVATSNPQIEFLILCGHTHSQAKYQPLSNLTIEVGSAEYYVPCIQKIIDI